METGNVSEPMQAEGLMKTFRFEDKNPSSLVNVDYIHMYRYIHVIIDIIPV